MNNPLNMRDPYGLCVICDLVKDNVVDPVGDTIDDHLDKAGSLVKDVAENAGYIDVNFTACAALCITAGVQASFGEGIHGYGGGGFGEGIGASAQYAPGQHISSGISCAVAGSPGLVSGQVGRSGLSGKEGQLFGEVGVNVGTPGFNVTCTYVTGNLLDLF